MVRSAPLPKLLFLSTKYTPVQLAGRRLPTSEASPLELDHIDRIADTILQVVDRGQSQTISWDI